jgi:spermidine/putrescine transport system permease protein
VADAADDGPPAATGLSGTVRNWLVMSPALAWLAVFLVVPLVYVARTSLSADPSALTAIGWSFDNYTTMLPTYWGNLVNSLLIGLGATIIAFAIATPVAYGISFYGGSQRTVLLFAFVAPFLTSYLIRVVSWQTLLGANGPVFGTFLHLTGIEIRVLGTPFAVIAGLSYQLVPFVLLPIYAAFNRVDRTLCAAADDLYSTRCGAPGACWGALAGLVGGVLFAFILSGRQPVLDGAIVAGVAGCTVAAALLGWRMTERFVLVVLPLSRNGFVAAAVLTFIPALGDYVNASLLGNVRTQMLGNVIQAKFLVELDYAGAAAAATVLLVTALILLFVLLRIMRGREILDVV